MLKSVLSKAQIPEPWRSYYDKVLKEQGQDWMDRYGEASLRAAMTVAGEPALPDPLPETGHSEYPED